MHEIEPIVQVINWANYARMYRRNGEMWCAAEESTVHRLGKSLPI